MDPIGWLLLGGALAFGASLAVVAACYWAAGRREHTCNICGDDLNGKFAFLTPAGRLCEACWRIIYDPNRKEPK